MGQQDKESTMETSTHNTTAIEESNHEDTEIHMSSSHQNTNSNDAIISSSLPQCSGKEIDAGGSVLPSASNRVRQSTANSSPPEKDRSGQSNTNQTTLISNRAVEHVPSTATATTNPLSHADQAKFEARNAQAISSNPPPIQRMVMSKRAAQYATTGNNAPPGQISNNTSEHIASTAMAATIPQSLTDLPEDLMPGAMPTAPTLQLPTLRPGAYRGSAGTMERNPSLYKGGQRILGRETDTVYEGDSTRYAVCKQSPSSRVPDGEAATSEHPQDAAPTPTPTAGNLNVNSLVEARRISETIEKGKLAQAEEVDPAEEERKLIQLKKKKKQLLWRIGFTTFAICSIILSLALGLTLGRKDAPKISLENRVLSLLPTYTKESIAKDDISPQSKAYNWIMADRNLDTYSDKRIIQRFALGTLYFATNGDDWINNANWMSYEWHECEWHAEDAAQFFVQLAGELIPETVITPFLNVSFPCEDPIVAKQYSHLWLLTNRLKGQLPQEVYLLTSLKTIALGFNSLSGPGLSTEIGKLSSLEGLDLSWNQISGAIPTEIGLLSRLGVGLFSKNKLSSPIPSQLGQLSDNDLAMLDLRNNQLVGSIPQELGSLAKMLSLLLYDNQLSGTIPTSIGQLSEMKWLALDKNELLGPIPSELGLLKSLAEVWLSQNRLTGTVPWEIGNLVTNGSLKLFHIYTNNFTGTLPTDDLCLIDTVSNYGSQLIGCNCTCSYQRHGFQLCSPLPSHCERLL